MSDKQQLNILASQASDTIISEILSMKREKTSKDIDDALSRINDHSHMLAGILKQTLNYQG